MVHSVCFLFNVSQLHREVYIKLFFLKVLVQVSYRTGFFLFLILKESGNYNVNLRLTWESYRLGPTHFLAVEQEKVLGTVTALLQVHHVEEKCHRTHGPGPPTDGILAIHVGPVPAREPGRFDDGEGPPRGQLAFSHFRSQARRGRCGDGEKEHREQRHVGMLRGEWWESMNESKCPGWEDRYNLGVSGAVYNELLRRGA